VNKVFFFEKEIFEKRKEEDRYVFGNFLVAERAHNLLRIEGLYEVMWKVLGITEEEMCVKISLAFYRTFGAVGLLFMFKERYMFPLDLCLSS
jgi:hypothetical protein